MFGVMPLDPNRFRQKRRSAAETLRLAVEWAAIIFAGMLAVLFLSWSITLQMPPLGKHLAFPVEFEAVR
jgi:hypothetical protein